MKSKLFRLSPIIALVVLLFVGAMPAHAAKIRVVTTLTDLADFARNIGGDQVEVHSLATGVEDTHGVPMKPSFVPMMNRADLLIVVGLDCEHAFLPALLEASKNPRIQIDKPGYVDCSEGIIPLRCTQVNRSLRGRRSSLRQPALHARSGVGEDRDREHLQRPGRLRPAVSSGIHAQPRCLSRQAQRQDRRVGEGSQTAQRGEVRILSRALALLRGIASAWIYFGTIELRPGIDPTPRHIEELITSDEGRACAIVVREPQFPEKVPRRIAEQTGATMVTLPIMPGGVPHTETYIKMMDYIVHTMVTAAQARNKNTTKSGSARTITRADPPTGTCI